MKKIKAFKSTGVLKIVALMKKFKALKSTGVLKIVALVAVLLVMMMWLAGVFRHKIEAGPAQEPTKVATGQTARVEAVGSPRSWSSPGPFGPGPRPRSAAV